MLTTAFTLSLPSLLLPPRHRFPNSTCLFLPRASCDDQLHSSANAVAFPCQSWSSLCSNSPLQLRPRSWPLSESRFVVVMATAAPDSATEEPKGNAMEKTLELGLLFGLWYLFNIHFNIYNKQVLKVFHYPVTVTGVQFAVGTVLVLFMWTFNLYKRPKITVGQLAAILPLAELHALGNLFTHMSLGKAAVSFTHTIKTMVPFFSVVLSAMFLGEIHKPFSLNQRPNRNSSYKCAITPENARMCECFDLHTELVPYGDAWNWQKDIVKEKKEMIGRNEDCSDTLILLQHNPVYTLGTGSSVDYLNFSMNDHPLEVFRTERGGEVTYHGPGQLVMYPIINLRNHKMDLHWYLRALEEVVIRVLDSTFSIKASRLDGLTGVWVGNQKVAAIGIKVSNWITFHGLALNVATDLTPFASIIPCGIKDRAVGSIKCLLKDNGQKHRWDDVTLIDITYNSLVKEFSEVFQFNIHFKTPPNYEVLVKKPVGPLK